MTHFGLFNFQASDGSDASHRPSHGMFLVHLGTTSWTRGTTLAVMMEMDLIVFVDTGAAHLAGALDLPVAVMLLRVAERRRIERRDTSHWYPTLGIFQRQQLGDGRTL